MINRRRFLAQVAGAAAVSRLTGQSAGEWGSPVLDIHYHFRRTPEANLAHLDGAGISKAVMLTPVAAADQAKSIAEKHPARFVYFTSGDVTRSDAIGMLRSSVGGGSRGFGEIKLHLPLDSPEMRRLYALAAELNVPVLLHFEDGATLDASFNSGFSRFPEILKAYPKTTFIGHANSFWANVSADVPAGVAYPHTAIKPGGLTDKLLADFPNLYGDLSANSGNNSLNRDPDFARGFLARHQDKLMFGSDCPCTDGHGGGQSSNEPRIKGRCVARETLSALQRLASPEVFRKIVWQNGTKLLRT